MNPEEIRWHRVNASSDAKPMLWKFSGLREVIPFGGSIFLGLVSVNKLTESFGWPLQMSFAVASLLPLGMLAFLLQFVCGKPRKHLSHTIQWWRISVFKKSLIENPSEKGGLE